MQGNVQCRLTDSRPQQTFLMGELNTIPPEYNILGESRVLDYLRGVSKGLRQFLQYVIEFNGYHGNL